MDDPAATIRLCDRWSPAGQPRLVRRGWLRQPQMTAPPPPSPEPIALSLHPLTPNHLLLIGASGSHLSASFALWTLRLLAAGVRVLIVDGRGNREGPSYVYGRLAAAVRGAGGMVEIVTRAPRPVPWNASTELLIYDGNPGWCGAPIETFTAWFAAVLDAAEADRRQHGATRDHPGVVILDNAHLMLPGVARDLAGRLGRWSNVGLALWTMSPGLAPFRGDATMDGADRAAGQAIWMGARVIVCRLLYHTADRHWLNTTEHVPPELLDEAACYGTPQHLVVRGWRAAAGGVLALTPAEHARLSDGVASNDACLYRCDGRAI